MKFPPNQTRKVVTLPTGEYRGFKKPHCIFGFSKRVCMHKNSVQYKRTQKLNSKKLDSIPEISNFFTCASRHASKPGARKPFFNLGVKVKNKVLWRNMICWFSPGALAELTTGHIIFVMLYVNAVVSNVSKLDKWSLPLLWHLSNISAMCNL